MLERLKKEVLEANLKLKYCSTSIFYASMELIHTTDRIRHFHK